MLSVFRAVCGLFMAVEADGVSTVLLRDVWSGFGGLEFFVERTKQRAADFGVATLKKALVTVRTAKAFDVELEALDADGLFLVERLLALVAFWHVFQEADVAP